MGFSPRTRETGRPCPSGCLRDSLRPECSHLPRDPFHPVCDAPEVLLSDSPHPLGLPPVFRPSPGWSRPGWRLWHRFCRLAEFTQCSRRVDQRGIAPGDTAPQISQRSFEETVRGFPTPTCWCSPVTVYLCRDHTHEVPALSHSGPGHDSSSDLLGTRANFLPRGPHHDLAQKQATRPGCARGDGLPSAPPTSRVRQRRRLSQSATVTELSWVKSTHTLQPNVWGCF